MVEQPTSSRFGRPAHQVIHVTVRGGYRPRLIVAQAGVPLRVVFHREDDDPCTERVVFSSPHIERRLEAGEATTVELPAQPPGDVRFTCAMGRYRGLIRLVSGRPASVAFWLRARAAQLEPPLAAATGPSGGRSARGLG